MNAVVFKQPGQKPVTLFVEKVDLELMNGLIGGFIERVPFMGEIIALGNARVDLWCDEEGKLKNLPVNFRIPGDIITGPVLALSNNDDGESLGLSGPQHKLVLEILSGIR